MVLGYGAPYLTGAVYDVARFTGAAGYVADVDLDVWRSSLMEILAEVTNDASAPVTALGAGVWALALTGDLDDTILAGSSPELNGKTLSELPAMLAALQKGDGSFAWNFDGTYPGYTEPTVIGALALEVVGGYETQVLGAVAVLGAGVGATGESYFEIGKSESGGTFYYSGEALEVMREISDGLFRQGDANVDGAFDLADSIFILEYLFARGTAPSCDDSADINDDGSIDIADAVYLLGCLFREAAAPKPPFDECGIDLTVDGLGCLSYPPCLE